MDKWTKVALASNLMLAGLLTTGCGQPTHSPRPIDNARVQLIRSEIEAGTGGGTGGGSSKKVPTGAATLTGSFKFAQGDAGQFTTPESLAVTGDDAAYCSKNGAPKSSALLVKPSGEIQNIVIFLGDDVDDFDKHDLWLDPKKAPGGNTESVVFDQKECVFLTPVVAMQVSQPMRILNSDGVGHNTKLENNSDPISKIIPPGGGIDYKHPAEERSPYPVSCNIHPWMRAFILVRENGYFSLTDSNGNFTIESLPAGVDLNMKVWHEKVGFLRDVTVNGTKTQWSGRGFTLSLKPGEETKLDVVVDATAFK